MGIFVGDGLMVDAPHPGAVVRLDRITGVTPRTSEPPHRATRHEKPCRIGL